MNRAPDRQHEADLLCQFGLHIVISEIFALIEPVRRHVAQAHQPRGGLICAMQVEWVQKIGAGLVILDHDLVFPARKIGVQCNRTTVAAIGESYAVFKGHNAADGGNQGRGKAVTVQGDDRLGRSLIPVHYIFPSPMPFVVYTANE